MEPTMFIYKKKIVGNSFGKLPLGGMTPVVTLSICSYSCKITRTILTDTTG